MTADQRLDQLELLVSEALTVLDRHTSQLKQLTGTVGQIITILTQQSENIAFLLQEHIVIKNDVATLKTDVAELKTDMAGLKTDMADLKSDMKLTQTEFGNKLDLILTKLN